MASKQQAILTRQFNDRVFLENYKNILNVDFPLSAFNGEEGSISIASRRPRRIVDHYLKGAGALNKLMGKPNGTSFAESVLTDEFRAKWAYRALCHISAIDDNIFYDRAKSFWGESVADAIDEARSIGLDLAEIAMKAFYKDNPLLFNKDKPFPMINSKMFRDKLELNKL